jgi:hypothetical protein
VRFRFDRIFWLLLMMNWLLLEGRMILSDFFVRFRFDSSSSEYELLNLQFVIVFILQKSCSRSLIPYLQYTS